jgi:hypothetical protein
MIDHARGASAKRKRFNCAKIPPASAIVPIDPRAISKLTQIDPMSPKEIEQAYRALGPVPEFWGRATWVDRLNTFDRFIAHGGIEADVLRTIERILTAEEFQDYIALDPALYELLMVAFQGEHETYELQA